MTTPNDGGSIAPNMIHRSPDYAMHMTAYGGLSIRDYFAAMAMQGFLSNPRYAMEHNTEKVSEDCFTMADYMIQQRTKPQ